ncbi:hypothetical protein [Mucilaginibacter sp.]|uniref:hypothetical protein n=1 Tax=Mucilaginibacter sp. TaxID=1882438 RepID=UPI0025CD844C|nr:hypothetical protein [Mucilaginibacter sp.]
MKKISFIIIFLFFSYQVVSQQLLMAWSQQDIPNYTKDMYDAAQKWTSSELLAKNLTSKSWSDVFLTLNASINNYSKDSSYLKALTGQLLNNTETKLDGTNRLIIWDRIVSKDIIFEGKGLIIDNDLYKVAGRANQLLQSLTHKNFGPVTINLNEKDLKKLQGKWLSYLSNLPVEEYKPTQYKNAKIAKICSPSAVHALIISLQNAPRKAQIIIKCLSKVYNLDKMPEDKSSPANFCDPDSYTYTYLGMLFGDAKPDAARDANWWQDFWQKKHDKLIWNEDKGIYEVSK